MPSGTVIVTIPAGVATSASGVLNAASTSTDNVVTYGAALTLTINQAIGQDDPTEVWPILFDVVFSEPVIGLTAADVVISGTAGATKCTLTGSGAVYTVTVAGPGWCDDFERPTIGPDWEQDPGPGEIHSTWLIDSHAVSETNAAFNTPTPGIYGTDPLYRVGDFGAAQWCEITVDNFWPPLDEHDFTLGLSNYYPIVEIHLNADPGNLSADNVFRVQAAYTSLDTWTYNCGMSPGCGDTTDDTSTTVAVPAADADETTVITLRMESNGVDELRAYFNGVLVLEQHYFAYVGGPVGGRCTGARIGLRAIWSGTATVGNPNPVPTVGPRILSACGGDNAVFCDAFERADGALGPNWLVPAPSGWSADSTQHAAVIIDGAATNTISSGDSSFAAASLSTDPQSIEVLVENTFDASNPGAEGYITLMTNMTPGSMEAHAVDFNFTATDDIAIGIFRFNAAGAWVSEYPGVIHWDHIGEVEPLSLRIESYASGAMRVYVDTELVWEYVYPVPVVGNYVGAEILASSGKTPVRILSACVGSDPLGGTVIASIPAGVATSIATGTPNPAATSTDNTVTYVGCSAVLEEPFNDLANWTGGVGTLVAGRYTGTGYELVTNTSAMKDTYTFPSGTASNYVTVGFAVKLSSSVAHPYLFYLTAGGVQQIRLEVNSGTLRIYRSDNFVFGQSDDGIFLDDTWHYVEVQVFVDDTAGWGLVRLDGVKVIGSGVGDSYFPGDTRASGSALIDGIATVGGTSFGTTTSTWDDMYITTGPKCLFQGDHVIT